MLSAWAGTEPASIPTLTPWRVTPFLLAIVANLVRAEITRRNLATVLRGGGVPFSEVDLARLGFLGRVIRDDTTRRARFLHGTGQFLKPPLAAQRVGVLLPLELSAEPVQLGP